MRIRSIARSSQSYFREHPIWYPLLVPFLAAVIGTILLLMMTLIPQDWVRDKTKVSSEEFTREGLYYWHFPQVLPPNQTDNPTEEFMIETSFRMDSVRDVFLKTLSKNPYKGDEFFNVLYDVASGVEHETWDYSRYWMGFRLFIRPLLCLFALNRIRFLCAICYFLLFVGLIASLSHNGKISAAFAFACACALVEPHAVAFSIKCSCCFLLMMVFGLIISQTELTIRDPRAIALFCLSGALTQFFDFYDNPLLTCIIPLLILVCKEQKCVKNDIPGILKLVLAWLASYIIMWLIGSLFVTLFTEKNGFQSSLKAAYGRLGIGKYKDERYSYSPVLALQTVCYWSVNRILWSLESHEVAYRLFFTAVIITAIVSVIARLRSGSWGKIPSYFFIGLLPILWIAVTAEPTIIHKNLQYRIVCGLYFSWFLLLSEAIALILRRKKPVS